MSDYKRSWCARMQYPDRDEFMFGTVTADTLREAEAAIMQDLMSIMPLGCPEPAILGMIPGIMVFTPEDDAK